MKHEWYWVGVVRGEQNMAGGQSWWVVVHKSCGGGEGW